jgi:hypothetical protein
MFKFLEEYAVKNQFISIIAATKSRMIPAKFQALNPDFKPNWLKTRQKHT